MFTIADLIERMTIQGNVVIRVYDSIKEDMITRWETEDFECEYYKIPYGIATMCIGYMYSVNSKKDDDEYGTLVIEVVEEEEDF